MINEMKTAKEILNEKFKDNLPSEFEGEIWEPELIDAMEEYASQDKCPQQEGLIQSSVDKRSEILSKKYNIDEKTSGHNYEYLFRSILQAMEEYSVLCQNELLRQMKIASHKISDEIKYVQSVEEAGRSYVKTLPALNYKSAYDFGMQNIKAFKEGAKWQEEKNNK